MAATAQQQLDEANDSLLRILQTDTAGWAEAARNQQQLQIDKLYALIEKLESKVAIAGGRSFTAPITRVNV